jgi:thiamine-phosphate pyrophosphorylase
MKKVIVKLCVITDTVIQNKYSHMEIAKMAIDGGADMIQFRDKFMSTLELIDTAIQLRILCNKHDVTFIVNDRVDIAMISGADGVHLGLEDISIKDARKLLRKDIIIGATAHSVAEAKNAADQKADYIGFGHIYPTSTKIKKTKPKGLKMLAEVCSKIKLPVIAIGGIGTDNASDIMSAGAYGIAVISSVLKSKEPIVTVKKLRNITHAGN